MTGAGLFSLVITIAIVGIIFYLIYWFLGEAGLPAPFDKVARILIALCAIAFLIGILTGQVPLMKLDLR